MLPGIKHLIEIAAPVRKGLDHRTACTVRFSDYGIIGNVEPFVFKAHAVMPILRFPVRVSYEFAVRH